MSSAVAVCDPRQAPPCLFLGPSALQKEVETLTTEHSESRRQAEKDCAALLSQMRVLESELEEQLLQHQGCAQQIEEATILKQQLAALDKHLRSQRQFMDVRSLHDRFYPGVIITAWTDSSVWLR